MIGAPPFEAGPCHVSRTLPEPVPVAGDTAPVSDRGAVGATSGTRNDADAADAGPVPTALIARTVHAYVLPADNDPTTTGDKLRAPVRVVPPFELTHVARYPVIGDPFADGATNRTDAAVPDTDTATLEGAAGTPATVGAATGAEVVVATVVVDAVAVSGRQRASSAGRKPAGDTTTPFTVIQSSVTSAAAAQTRRLRRADWSDHAGFNHIPSGRRTSMCTCGTLASAPESPTKPISWPATTRAPGAVPRPKVQSRETRPSSVPGLSLFK